MVKIYTLILACLIGTQGLAQDEILFQLSGSITGGNEVLADELIYIFKSDSSLYRTTLSDSKGEYSVALEQGKYFLSIQNPLYNTFKSALIDLTNNLVLPSIDLLPKVSDIAEVQVKAVKPVIERLPGKMVFNVEQSLQSTGSSAWQIIEKSPGVLVTSNDQILVNGKGGVVVHLNGKLLRMSGSDLADYLRSIGSASVEKIEFITNPMANYDANGVVIIDIRMKKDARFGTNGSVSLNTGMGFYPKAGSNIQLNHRNKKWSSFVNYGYNFRKGFNDLRLQRQFYNEDSLYLVYDQRNYMTFPFQSHLFRIGTDYAVSDKMSISLQANANQNGFVRSGLNHSSVLDGERKLVSTFDTHLGGFNRWTTAGSNLSLTRNIDTLGSKWILDLDYSRFLNSSNQEIATHFYNLQNEPVGSPYELFGDLDGVLDIYAVKWDLGKNLGKSKLDLGAKSSFVRSDNRVLFYDQSNKGSVLDTGKSNHFLYDEWIHAAYGTFSKEWKKFSMVGGLRIESTQIQGKQIVNNQRFDTAYIQAFPSVSLGYAANDNHHVGLNMNRRIERPSYGQLNPFKFYLDPTTFREGNPYLRPQTTYNLEVNYTLKNKYFFQVGLARTENNIIEIIAPSAADQKITVQTNVNLKHTDLIFLNTSLPIDINKWWLLRVDGGIYKAAYTGQAAATQLSGVGTWNGNLQLNNQFKVGKVHSFELSAQVQSREVYAFDRIRPRGGVGLSYQWKCLKEKGTFRANFTDLFYTEKIFADVQFTGYKEYFEVRRETRVATLSFAYRFGSMKGANGSKRGGAEELKQRAGGGIG